MTQFVASVMDGILYLVDDIKKVTSIMTPWSSPNMMSTEDPAVCILSQHDGTFSDFFAMHTSKYALNPCILLHKSVSTFKFV